MPQVTLTSTFMTVLSAELKFRIEQHNRDRFHAKALSLGLKPSELLRNMVLAVIDEEADKHLVIPDSDNAEPVKITLSLPAFLIHAAKRRAKGRGMVLSRWLSSLVQSNLTGQPVMSTAELQALKTSNRELAAVGRNINQIAKALNQAFYETEKVRIDTLAELAAVIDANSKAIWALVRASQNAWEAEE